MRLINSPSLAVKSLDWAQDSHTVFSAIAQQPWAMLLDSSHTGHQDANYDIIVFNPVATIESIADNIQWKFHQKITKNQDFAPKSKTRVSLTVFDVIQQLQTYLYPVKQSSQLPFSGGVVGSFNYDLGRIIEKLPQQALKDIQLNDVNLGFYDFALLYCHQQHQWLAVHYLGEEALNIELNKIDNLISIKDSTHETQEFTLTSSWINQTTKQQYTERFNKVQQYLHQGDCYQINLTQRFSASYKGDEWQAYCALSDANKAPFSAFIRLKNHCILSISPERFIQLHDNKISTKPIKGTMPRGATSDQDSLFAEQLRQSEKDLAENVMIVDLLRNDISKVATAGSVNVPKLFEIESFPAVHHLVSTVEATLDSQYDAVDLLKAAFPGGSITGAPKIRSMEIIEELEPSRRNIYCGSIGYISQDGRMDTSITIRTLVTEDNKLYCWAGGGIVADSNVDAEYQESFDKVSKILPILTNVNQSNVKKSNLKQS
ncbi:aminodeoxychorismate synthase component I [Shewanella japonica]|uniref:aminodeoxychorismate synthase component I n=1 Tax=Shewanella japonica TaxID=93973 RepID=UPI0024958B94|nr:aminodeoxychorismate synthase component I [Shewanella japonica]